MNNKQKAILSTTVAALIGFLSIFLPLPYYLETAGDAFLLDEMIIVDAKQDQDLGAYSMTTIGISQATPLTALSSLLPYRDLVSEEDLFSGVDSGDQYDFIQELYMKNSVDAAIQVAYRAAGKNYEVVYQGVYVLEVMPDSDFSGQLQLGDLITQVDHLKIQQAQDLTNYLSSKDCGDQVTLHVKRNKQIFTIEGELTELEDGQAGIGIALVNDSDIKTDPDIQVDFGDIGGPSAGLMYTLYIYEQLTNKDLNGDLHISGTGTINDKGEVGPIGGAGKKVIAADRAGADIFFVPDEEITPALRQEFPDYQTNAEEAQEAAATTRTKMKIVPVKTFSEALEYLEKLK